MACLLRRDVRGITGGHYRTAPAASRSTRSAPRAPDNAPATWLTHLAGCSALSIAGILLNAAASRGLPDSWSADLLGSPYYTYWMALLVQAVMLPGCTVLDMLAWSEEHGAASWSTAPWSTGWIRSPWPAASRWRLLFHYVLVGYLAKVSLKPRHTLCCSTRNL